MNPADLSDVSTSTLVRLRGAILGGQLRTPVDASGLIAFGIRNQVGVIAHALAGHRSAACIAVLDVTLAERADRKPAPELVWTGPEASSATARDTAVVLRSLFESARESVILAGYSFSHAHEVLEPLYRSMRDHGCRASFFVNVQQIEHGDPAEHLRGELENFVHHNWPFGDPMPRIYYDKRALTRGPPWCSLHAKCVTVDGLQAFISSANFTQRGQDRNIEAGVLIRDANFASHLASQWMGLVDAGMVGEWRG